MDLSQMAVDADAAKRAASAARAATERDTRVEQNRQDLKRLFREVFGIEVDDSEVLRNGDDCFVCPWYVIVDGHHLAVAASTDRGENHLSVWIRVPGAEEGGRMQLDSSHKKVRTLADLGSVIEAGARHVSGTRSAVSMLSDRQPYDVRYIPRVGFVRTTDHHQVTIPLNDDLTDQEPEAPTP